MNILTPIVERRAMSLADLDAYMDRLAGGGSGLSAAGQNVTVDSALRYPIFWACVRAIAETCASLPCLLYRRLPNGGKERAVDHRLYAVLHDQPNPWMTAMDYWEVVLTQALTWGNHYSQVERDAYGARALWPLDPSRMRVGADEAGNLEYTYRRKNGTERVFAFGDIFHVHGLSWNGYEGLSVLAYIRETIGLGISLDEFAARYFGQGTQTGGTLQHPGKLSDTAAKRIAADWTETHAGIANSHKVVVLEEGMTFAQTTIPPEDSQFLQSRQWQDEEVARWFRVPQHVVGLLAHATFSNIEHQQIQFVTGTIRPWLVRVEQAIHRDVIQISDGKRDHFAEFLVDGLLRGDIQTRYQAYAVGRQNGWLNGDDIRAFENMNPIPGGQGKPYLVNGNMKTVEQILEPPKPPPAPKPPAPAEPTEDQSQDQSQDQQQAEPAAEGEAND